MLRSSLHPVTSASSSVSLAPGPHKKQLEHSVGGRIVNSSFLIFFYFRHHVGPDLSSTLLQQSHTHTAQLNPFLMAWVPLPAFLTSWLMVLPNIQCPCGHRNNVKQNMNPSSPLISPQPPQPPPTLTAASRL